MRIPFPLALNIGTDIICISRLLKPSQSAISKLGSTYESTSRSLPSPSSRAALIHLSRLSTRFLHPKELVELSRRFPFLQQYLQFQHPNHSRNLRQKPKDYDLGSHSNLDFDEAESKLKPNPNSANQGQSHNEQNNDNNNLDVNETSIKNLATHLAGRWAAKEAAKKAWGAKLLSFKDLRVEILDSSSGEVGVICQSYGLKEDEDEDENCDGSENHIGSKNESGHGSENHGNGSVMEQVAKLSISHDGDYAVATVIATPLHGDILRELEMRRERAWKKVGRRI